MKANKPKTSNTQGLLKRDSKNKPKITTNLDKLMRVKLATSFGELLAETFIGTSMP